jgi:3-deoxy-manno-octulosonate cytidylyltransferase (CMP-KDO synthetase)
MDVLTSVVCIVPARLQSTRLPGKVLLPICGKPMVVRTLERATEAACFARIVCATGDQEVAQVVKDAGFEVFFDQGQFTNGTERVHSCALRSNHRLILNLQADEPIIGLDILQTMARELQKHPDAVHTACQELDESMYSVASVVKVELDSKGFAKSFFRLGARRPSVFQHKGIYAYSAANLDWYIQQKPGPQEQQLSLEQMRFLNKVHIKVHNDPFCSHAVDVREDVEKVESLMQKELGLMI